jgi:hypothetical protein
MKVKTATHWGHDKAHERYGAGIESTEIGKAPVRPTEDEIFEQARQPLGRGMVNHKIDAKAAQGGSK